MDFWNKAKQPPKEALRQIGAGRLKGKSDINPQWRIQVMTEHFGMCGIGWRYEIKKLWTLPGTNDQVFAFADIDLFVKDNGEWSAPIPGHGGSMLLVQEKNGIHNNDEAFKMAVTDALSTAMKAIGVAADIYLGRWDGTQYHEEPGFISPEQVKEITELIESTGSDKAKFLMWIKAPSIDKIPASQYQRVMVNLEAKRKAA
ncbi:hypothetical protein [Desulfobacter postgatei]|uniref:hypothetical protein n=1 Tax=Desulfobacter postgatei TaxID=2293 RepID=UPI002FDB2CE6